MNALKKLTTLLAVALCASANALTWSSATSSELLHPGTGNLYVNGEIAEYVQVFHSKQYEVVVSAGGLPCDGVYPLMALRVDHVTEGILTVNTHYWADYKYTVHLDAGVHRVALAFINDEINDTGDRNLYTNTITVRPVGGGTDPVRVSQGAWLAAAVTMESDVVAATDAAIEAHRTSPAVVRVVDAQGNPVHGAQVTVAQETHDFLFGANFMAYKGFNTTAKNNAYEQRFADVFNYATAPFFWSWFEPVQGQPNYPYLDSLVNALVARNITVKGHPLLWDQADMLPAWTGGNPTQQQMQKRVNDIMSRYDGLISAWEVVNEPTVFGRIGLAQPHQWARALSPNGTLIVNDYGQFVDDELRQYHLVQNAIANGVPIDAVGFQAHAPVDMAFPLKRVQRVLDTYAALGKAIHITEFTPPSSGIPVTGAVWRGNWTEQTQAAYAEDFYRVAFAHPAVAAVSWWDFTDHNAWVPNGGLLRADLSPKPAYDALKRLITEEWRTSVQAATNVGEVAFRGFHGRHSAQVTFNGVTKQASFHIRKDGANTVTLVLDGVNAAPQPEPQPEPAPADTVAPVITLTGAAVVTHSVGTAYSDAGASASDNVDGNISHLVQVSGSVNTAKVGVYTLTYTVSDAAGNAATPVTRTVQVVDNVAPVITLLGSSSVSIRRNTAYNDAGATALDNHDGDITNKIVATSTVNTSKTGTYYVQYNVVDAAGNAAATVIRTVRVTLR